MQNIRFINITLTCLLPLALLCSCGEKKDTSGSRMPPSGPSDYQNIIKEAYGLKKTGNNDGALKLFQKAALMVEENSEIHASSLDDRASVLLRIGKTDEAEKLYRQAIGILTEKAGSPMLLAGIRNRLDTLLAMKKRKITCSEPGAYPADARVPYFPNVPAFQEALGKLTPAVADCHKSDTIEPITLRAVITGDGKFIRAQARGTFAGTPVEKCVIARLEKLIPGTELPPFGACFRGFMYPFMLGNHPEKIETPKEEGPLATPDENLKKGKLPNFEGAMAGAARLLETYKTGKEEEALQFFFPAEAFDVVKDSSNPSRYYGKLVDWFREDIVIEARRFKGADWELDSLEPGNCKWMAPGTESNKIGYWSCIGNIAVAKAADETRKFEIRVMINWGKNWYVTHLRPIRKE